VCGARGRLAELTQSFPYMGSNPTKDPCCLIEQDKLTLIILLVQ